MPTEKRIAGAAYEISETLKALAYDVGDLVGPIKLENEDSEVEQKIFYITAEGSHGAFYIAFSDQYDFANVVYPYNIATSMSDLLTAEEIESIIGVSPDWDKIDNDYKRDLLEKAGLSVIENTPIEALRLPQFHLSAYGSTAIVSYTDAPAENGFPREFQCKLSIFPYTENTTLRELDYRVDPVLIAGERARRYVESSFYIDKEGEPSDYELRALF